jgi:hypothetical protein
VLGSALSEKGISVCFLSERGLSASSVNELGGFQVALPARGVSDCAIDEGGFRPPL